MQPVAAFHQQPRHLLTVGRRRRVAGLFQRLEEHVAINGFVFIRAGGAPRLKQHVALQVGKRGILDKRQGRGRDMFQGQGRLGTDGDAVAAPDAAGQSPVQDIHRPVGVASEDALRAYADAAPAPDAMILVEFKRNHMQSFGSVSEKTPFPGGFPPFVSEEDVVAPVRSGFRVSPSAKKGARWEGERKGGNRKTAGGSPLRAKAGRAHTRRPRWQVDAARRKGMARGYPFFSQRGPSPPPHVRTG